jgi:hypothetical protein
MKHKTLLLLFATIILSFLVSSVRAQSGPDELPKFEIGAHFTSLTKPGFGGGDTEPGFGGRFTYNINEMFALEAVGNFFPGKCRGCGRLGDNSGNIVQGLGGVKIGKRFQKWGVFGKGRAGLVSFSDGDGKWVINNPASTFPFEFQMNRTNNFAADIGGIVEFYPTKRLVTRFEAGDTLIHYRERTTNFISFDPVTGAPSLIPFTLRSETRHNFQFVAGIGWRF